MRAVRAVNGIIVARRIGTARKVQESDPRLTPPTPEQMAQYRAVKEGME